MAISQAFCTSAKVGFLSGTYAPLTDTMKIALYTSTATLDATTTAYSTTNEVVGTGYTAGGNTLAGAAISSASGTAWITFSDSSWTTSTITARGALIYNSTEGNKSVAVLDFGADKTVSNDTFQIIFPTADATSAIVRIS